MNEVASAIYFVLFFGGICINKYVLSVLGFKYPTIFQGWQTLAALIIYKLLNVFKNASYPITPVDRAGFISILPGLLFYTTSLVANSKALADIPVCVYLAVQNALPASIFLFDRLYPSRTRVPLPPVQGLAAVIVMLTAIGLVISESSLEFQESGYFWLIVGIVCNAASTLHARIADARFKSWDRLYFSSVFSVIILAPASLYLEEAFQALQFRHDRQELFVTGCLASAILIACLNLYSTVLKEDDKFGLVQNCASGATAILSVWMFPSPLSTIQYILMMLNLVAVIPIPSPMNRDEDEKPIGIIQSA
eukprot:TRINITY_DN12228_c0_g1_i11.p1 TRINITY_DN12228_c0_g1~~TRINITY_DN12228_c0_g1_i11.p1  ORF type:complete len:308 (-),score=47.88 TRINITY_DN12228_c0_g1_i11:238-1161(-)